MFVCVEDDEVGVVDRLWELRAERPLPTQRGPYLTRPVTTAALPIGPMRPDYRHHQSTPPPAIANPAPTSVYPTRRTQVPVGVRPLTTPPKPPTAMVAPLVGVQHKEPSKRSRSSATSGPSTRRAEAGSERSRSTTPSPDEKLVIHGPTGYGGLPPHSRVDIEKWKALVETKDRIISQKNQLIER